MRGAIDWHEQSLRIPIKVLLFSVYSSAVASCAQPQLLPRVNLEKQDPHNRLLVNQEGSGVGCRTGVKTAVWPANCTVDMGCCTGVNIRTGHYISWTCNSRSSTLFCHEVVSAQLQK